MNAEIICVGTELLLGDVINTNSSYIAENLSKLGIDVFYHDTVGDNPKRLTDCIKTAVERSNIVVITGGLGTTKDDITMQTACFVTGRERVLYDEYVKSIKEYHDRIGIKPTENNFRQAMLPSNATVFPNDLGTAPGCAIDTEKGAVLLLPGPPKEMKHMFVTYALPFLSKYSSGILRSHFIRVYGLGESKVDELMGDLLMSEDPTLSPYAGDGEMYLRVSSKAETAEIADEKCFEMVERVKKLLGGYIYGVDCGDLNFRAVELLGQHGKTVATAESCTGGMIGEMITEVPGASKVYNMGVVTYSNEAKVSLLGVSETTLNTLGAVSAETACQMAHGVRLRSGADIGIGVSGIAGPESDGTNKPIGLVYVAISTEKGDSVAECHFGGYRDRQYIRRCAALEAFNLIRMYLDDYEFFIKYHKFVKS